MDRFYSRIAWALIAGVFLVCIADGVAYAQSGAKGYVSRPCGFDMDDDDRVGEDGTQKFCGGGTNVNQWCTNNADCPSSTCSTSTNDDCNVCDGTTLDPDGDGVNEDQIYVDCNSGNDTSGDGSSGTPYRTISKALTVANGVGSNKEDIICVRATCASYNDPNGAAVGFTFDKVGVASQGPGGASYNEVTAFGNDPWNRRYPADPTMIVAWDTDNDGQYPPYDTDQSEPFVIDGCTTAGCTANGALTGIAFGSSDYMELAHVTIANFGRGNANNGYGLRWGASGVGDYHFVHDVILQDIFRDVDDADGRRVVDLRQSSANGTNYLTLENVLWTGTGAWPTRGWNNAGSHTLYKNVTEQNIRPGDASLSLGFKIWGSADIAYVDFLIDGTSNGSTSESRGITVGRDTDRTYILGGRFRDISQAINTEIMDIDGVGNTDGVYIRRNRQSFTKTAGTDAMFTLVHSGQTSGIERGECTTQCSAEDKACGGAGTGALGNEDCDCNRARTYLKNVEITDNVMDATNNTNLAAFVAYQNGQNCADGDTAESNYGPLLVANNSILNYNDQSTATSHGVFVLGQLPNEKNSSNWDWKYVKGDVTLYNNLVTGLNNDYAVVNQKRGEQGYGPLTGNAYYTPGTDFFADKNIYQGTNVKFRMGTTDYTTLSGWKSATSEDDNALACTPALESDGYHLTSTSNTDCARDNGSNTNCSAKDIDGDTRPVNTTCDIGADEVATSGGGSSPGTVQLAAQSYTMTEGGAPITVSVTRTAGDSGAASVNYSVIGVTAGAGASCDGSAAVDYITSSGSVSWTNADSATKTFTVTPCNDSTVEPNEVATIQLSSVSGAALGSPSWASLSIQDDEEIVGNSPLFDVVTGVKTVCDTTDSTTATIPSVTVLGGNNRPNRILVVTIGAEAAFNSGDPLCDLSDGGVSVVWNGHSLTRAGSAKGIEGTSSGACSGIFYYLNPEAATSDIVITFAGTATDKQASAFTIYDAAQQAPAVFAIGTTGAGQADSPISNNLTTLVTDTLVVDALALGQRVGGGNVTAGGGQVERADMSCNSGGSHTAVSTRETPTPGATPMSWGFVLQSGETGARRYAHTIAGFSATQIVTGTTTTSTTTTVTLPEVNAPTQGWICIGPCVPVQ